MTFYFVLIPTMFFVSCAIGSAAYDLIQKRRKK